MKQNKVIFWFRQDLRLQDNQSLLEASKNNKVLPIYIFDDSHRDIQIGTASKWWLHNSLLSLNSSMDNKLQVYRGNSVEVILKLIKQLEINSIYLNQCYEPYRLEQIKELHKSLLPLNISCYIYNGSVLWEPHTILKPDGFPFKIFTPFYKNACAEGKKPHKPFQAPQSLNLLTDPLNKTTIEQLNLISKDSRVSGFSKGWTPGEATAHKQLNTFIDKALTNYDGGRDFPAKKLTSRLSPYLHYGEISPNQIWHAVLSMKFKMNVSTTSIDKYLAELGWREFAYYTLFHFPTLPKLALNPRFNKFPWAYNDKFLKAWQEGQTGYPIIDAGMRELWLTGYMHNRVRMIVGSFLVKNLLLHWHEGAAWFSDCLVDADLASNNAGWQWVAGCGIESSPYFRVFNPVLQGEKFDREGDYVRQYCPELKSVSSKYLHKLWETPKEVLKEAGIVLGKNYPHPIVDLKKSRDVALNAFSKIMDKKD